MASPHYLQGVSKALSERVQALPHECNAVNLFAMPSTLDPIARSGQLQLFREYFDVIPRTSKAIAGAAAEGHLHVVQWIYTQLSGDKMKQSAWAVEAFKGAARGGQLAVLEWLKSEFEPSFEDTEDAAVEAATHGQLVVVQWLMEEYDGAGDAGALTAAVMADQRDVEEYLISICDDETCLDALGAALIAKAVENDTDRLEELSERCSELDVQEALEDAIECDAYEVVEVLWRSYHQGGQVDGYAIGLSVLSDALTRTVINDRVDVAAISIEADCMNLSFGVGDALKVAAATNRLDFVRLLLTKCMPHDVGSVLVAAVDHGHCDIVHIVYERCDQYAVGSALEKAASSYRWDIVETLYEGCEEGCRHVRDALEHAVASGELEMAKLLHRKCTQYDIENALYAAMGHNRWCGALTIGRALEKAASQARWELVELMYDNGAGLGGYAVGDVLAEAASIGRWDVVQYLQDKAKGYGVSRALSKAVAGEELSTVELLCVKCNLLDVAVTMDEAAMDSRWCVVQVLAKLYVEKIAATTGKVYLIERVLERAAAEGQLGIVKLLYDKCDDSSCYVGVRATPEVREFLAANCGGLCARESQPVEAPFYVDDLSSYQSKVAFS